MKTIKNMTNTDRALVLLNLFAHQKAEIVKVVSNYTDIVLSNEVKVMDQMKDSFFSPHLWIDLAKASRKKCDTIITEHGGVYSTSKIIEMLFDGYQAMFTVQALNNRIESKIEDDEKFGKLVDVLFS